MEKKTAFQRLIDIAHGLGTSSRKAWDKAANTLANDQPIGIEDLDDLAPRMMREVNDRPASQLAHRHS